MPTFEVGIDPCRDGGEHLVEAARLRLGAERGGDEVAHDFGVEGVAGEAEAGVAEDFALTIRAHGEQGEVAGATAKVADQDGFFVVER